MAPIWGCIPDSNASRVLVHATSLGGTWTGPGLDTLIATVDPAVTDGKVSYRRRRAYKEAISRGVKAGCLTIELGRGQATSKSTARDIVGITVTELGWGHLRILESPRGPDGRLLERGVKKREVEGPKKEARFDVHYSMASFEKRTFNAEKARDAAATASVVHVGINGSLTGSSHAP